MSSINLRWKATAGTLGIALVTLPLFAPLASAQTPIIDPAFDRVWSRTDKPVQDRVAARTWMWGPTPFYAGYEPYLEGPGGQHLVEYFDKSRMEINNPAADRNSPWFVTNGLLVVEMMSGRLQTGNASFLQIAPAGIPVAGDTGTSLNTPTYANLASLASLQGNNRFPDRTGQPVREGLTRNSGVGNVDNLAGFAKYGAYEPTLGHNIADVFWRFMNQRGIVYTGGRYGEDVLVDWVFAMGFPITEPYWMPIRVGAEERWVLVQAFQRRILTYSPYNPDGWKVEMGNVGRAYFDWRYAQTPPPAATPRPGASISIQPTQGNITTDITITGRNFPAHTAVLIGAEKASVNYFRNIGSLGTDANGNFSGRIKLPADASTLGEVTITASAANGSVRASANFRLSYDPQISVSPRSMVVTNGVLNVTGGGFPARLNVQLGLLFDGANAVEYRTNVRTNDNGDFQANLPVGARPVGARFMVVAMGDGGYKATYNQRITVIGQPGLAVEPATGPVNQAVTLYGWGWPVGTQVTVGTRGGNGQGEALMPNPVLVDGNGSFAVRVHINAGYANQREVKLFAIEPQSTVRVETSYLVVAPVPPTPTPQPGNPTVHVNPAVAAVGQAISVSGSRWPVGATVTVALSNAGAQEVVANGVADGAGNFSTVFALSPRWAGTGQVSVTASSGGGLIATTTLQITSGGGGGGIVESGLPMDVTTYRGPSAAYVKVSGAGWRAGKVIDFSVVSADGAINVPVGSTTVKGDGFMQMAFAVAAPWAGRADLGVAAAARDETTSSLRRLPLSDLVKVNGGTYNVRGANWPANADVVVVLRPESGAEQTVGGGRTDGAGGLNFNVDVPRVPDRSYIIEVRTFNRPGGNYAAQFEFFR